MGRGRKHGVPVRRKRTREDHLGERLAELRAGMGYTQVSLAQAAGLHVSAVTRLEGRASWDQVDWRVVREVARAVGRTVEEIAA